MTYSKLSQYDVVMEDSRVIAIYHRDEDITHRYDRRILPLLAHLLQHPRAYTDEEITALEAIVLPPKDVPHG